MTQKEFDEAVKKARQNYRERQDILVHQMQANKTAYKDVIDVWRKLIVPASKETKAKNEAYSLQRHLKHEIERFCEDKRGLTSEGADVQFVVEDEQVAFIITVPKK